MTAPEPTEVDADVELGPRDDAAPPAEPTSDVDAVWLKLDEVQDVVETARSMPMSASCVVNRADVLALLDDLRALLPDALVQAQEVLADREAVVEQGHAEAERIVEQAHAERTRLVAEAAVTRQAQADAEALLQDAYEQSEGMRVEVEDYVDAKLANFEIVLNKTLDAVERGRARLQGATEHDELLALSDDDN